MNMFDFILYYFSQYVKERGRGVDKVDRFKNKL